MEVFEVKGDFTISNILQMNIVPFVFVSYFHNVKNKFSSIQINLNLVFDHIAHLKTRR